MWAGGRAAAAVPGKPIHGGVSPQAVSPSRAPRQAWGQQPYYQQQPAAHHPARPAAARGVYHPHQAQQQHHQQHHQQQQHHKAGYAFHQQGSGRHGYHGHPQHKQIRVRRGERTHVSAGADRAVVEERIKKARAGLRVAVMKLKQDEVWMLKTAIFGSCNEKADHLAEVLQAVNEARDDMRKVLIEGVKEEDLDAHAAGGDEDTAKDTNAKDNEQKQPQQPQQQQQQAKAGVNDEDLVSIPRKRDVPVEAAKMGSSGSVGSSTEATAAQLEERRKLAIEIERQKNELERLEKLRKAEEERQRDQRLRKQAEDEAAARLQRIKQQEKKQFEEETRRAEEKLKAEQLHRQRELHERARRESEQRERDRVATAGPGYPSTQHQLGGSGGSSGGGNDGGKNAHATAGNDDAKSPALKGERTSSPLAREALMRAGPPGGFDPFSVCAPRGDCRVGFLVSGRVYQGIDPHTASMVTEAYRKRSDDLTPAAVAGIAGRVISALGAVEKVRVRYPAKDGSAEGGAVEEFLCRGTVRSVCVGRVASEASEPIHLGMVKKFEMRHKQAEETCLLAIAMYSGEANIKAQEIARETDAEVRKYLGSLFPEVAVSGPPVRESEHSVDSIRRLNYMVYLAFRAVPS